MDLPNNAEHEDEKATCSVSWNLWNDSHGNLTQFERFDDTCNLFFGAAMSNRKALLDEKLCQYLHKGRTLNDLRWVLQNKVQWNATESITK